MKFRNIQKNEIDIRVGTVTTKGYSLLLYKNARVDMAMLDEAVGETNWQRDHKEVKGNLYCGIGIWDAEKSQWIWKWDCGVESFSDKEKGEASDSFKRAGFNWGIGRELYTAPFIWINCECPDKKIPYEETKRINKMEVSELIIVDGEIKRLDISIGRELIFSYGIIFEHKGEPIVNTKNEIRAMMEMEEILTRDYPDVWEKLCKYKIELTKLAPAIGIQIYQLSINDIRQAISLKEQRSK